MTRERIAEGVERRTVKNCGVYNDKHDCFCTRPAGHEGYHVATFGPFASRWAKEIHRWPAEHATSDPARGTRP